MDAAKWAKCVCSCGLPRLLRGLQLVKRALLWALIRTPAQKLRSMTKAAVRDVVELHFADQLRLQRFPFAATIVVGIPAAGTARRLAGKPFATHQRLESLDQLQLFFRRE